MVWTCGGYEACFQFEVARHLCWVRRTETSAYYTCRSPPSWLHSLSEMSLNVYTLLFVNGVEKLFPLLSAQAAQTEGSAAQGLETTPAPATVRISKHES